MARGWESKAIEDQIGAAESQKDSRTNRPATTDELAQQARIHSLQLSRTEILNRLRAARVPRYRSQLELALKHLEDELSRLQKG